MTRYKIAYYISMLLFACMVVAIQTTQTDTPINKPITRFATRPLAPPEIFYPTFPLDRHPIGNVNCYRIKYNRTDEKTARHYAGLFGLKNEFNADEDGYHFEGKAGKLTVYRHAQQLMFIPAAPLDMEPEAFFESYKLPLAYEEIRVSTDGVTQTVTFVSYLDNLLNYAFNASCMLDANGKIIQADYFFIEYEKLNECRIKSMKDAFIDLPREGSKHPINLTHGQLVYSYENSVIQPAYFFEGEDAWGNTVEYFVKAAVYGELQK